MKDVVVIGAVKIGATVAGLLASTGDYQVTDGITLAYPALAAI